MREKGKKRIAKKIMEMMDGISYGFPDKSGRNILKVNPKKYEDKFRDFYFLQTPEELMKSKCGVCFEQVELERKLFLENQITVQTFFICTYDATNLPSHTFLVYQEREKYYWFEHSWGEYKGIHDYSNLKELLLDVKIKFINSHEASKDAYTFVYQYDTPSNHLTCDAFYLFMETQTLMKLNKPLYFYHVLPKNADVTKGILSLQYMYDHKLYALFDKNVSKYKNRIVKDWCISKYKGRKKESLTREEILEALRIFRGENGASYLYFFRYPLERKLGNKIKSLLQEKDIYRLNINDEEVQQKMKDIFYGYEENNSDNKVLTKEYYKNVTKEEYFANYDDTLEMNFSKLNHIAIAFINNFCPIEFLEKIDII